ncbi:hypothetical protein GYMLUDRAFT_252174 [Collybiopsis luxurians FD-317 M1]|uniref:Uncharacterized protein n=1 Tax=Collybiopsis luxurians FD-317 M1 TaxID=944289 RepID=A0A0D0AM58_9AGAR|nr:hypothetical protein GYMLUDRAFT_252174 [Collybiopsis luxurians FD-317 M1]
MNIILENNGAFDSGSAIKIPSFARTPDLEPSKRQDQYIGYGAAILFGAIHCAAWTFVFPSTVERVLWRVASLVVTCAPLCFAFMAHLRELGDGYLPDPWDKYLIGLILVFGYVVGLAYISARVTLIVLPFLALRDLPAAAFENVAWTSVIPHI